MDGTLHPASGCLSGSPLERPTGSSFKSQQVTPGRRGSLELKSPESKESTRSAPYCRRGRPYVLLILYYVYFRTPHSFPPGRVPGGVGVSSPPSPREGRGGRGRSRLPITRTSEFPPSPSLPPPPPPVSDRDGREGYLGTPDTRLSRPGPVLVSRDHPTHRRVCVGKSPSALSCHPRGSRPHPSSPNRVSGGTGSRT